MHIIIESHKLREHNHSCIFFRAQFLLFLFEFAVEPRRERFPTQIRQRGSKMRRNGAETALFRERDKKGRYSAAGHRRQSGSSAAPGDDRSRGIRIPRVCHNVSEGFWCIFHSRPLLRNSKTSCVKSTRTPKLSNATFWSWLSWSTF